MHAHREALAIPTAQECRERITSVRAEIIKSRVLRESASDLRQYNAELREFLREAQLTALTLYERWMDKGRFPPSKK